MGKILSEFKEFAMKGNVVDMAVGVIIGGAFGKIVSSLVNDVIMPVVGIATGGLDFKEHKLILKAAVMNGEEVVTPEVAMTYGVFIQNIVDFLIIAFCIFMVPFDHNAILLGSLVIKTYDFSNEIVGITTKS